MNNKQTLFCRISNNHPTSPIAFFKIVAVSEHDGWNNNSFIDEITDIETLYSESEVFYHIYGERYYDDKRKGTIFLGEFATLDKARDFIYYITGEVPKIVFH